MAKNTQAVVNSIVDLPSLPQVVTTLMSLLEDPKTSVRDVNRVLASDPALVAKLLKVVNSAFYAIPARVASIPQAIAILGFNTVRSLAISASVFDLFDEGSEDFSYPAFWTHSVGVAALSRFFAQKTAAAGGAVLPDNAFVAGLLQGIGKLILEQYANVEFQEILARAKDGKKSFSETEGTVLDTSYAEIGFWLMQRWKLPEEIQNDIRFQNRVGDCPGEYRRGAAILRFSKYLCRLKGYGAAGDFDEKPALPVEALAALGVTKEAAPGLMEGVPEVFERAEALAAVFRG